MINMNLVYPTLAVIGGGALLIDIFGHDHKKEMKVSTAIMWSVFWLFCGLVMGGCVYLEMGATAASEYFSGFAMEKALSLDNLMVFMAIFAYFGVRSQLAQHKVLTYGIIGAVVFRAIFASAGSYLFHLHWTVEVIFGLIVIWSAKAIVFGGDDDEDVDYSQTWYAKLINKVYPYDSTPNPASFFTTRYNKLPSGATKAVKCVTALFMCVVTIELSDVMFSFDSVPAVIAVSKELPVIYSAMMMAVLGLRALYFVLEALMKHLHHLEKAVALVLVFVGAKLIVAPMGLSVDPIYSLVVVLGLLATGVVASLIFPPKDEVE